MKVPGYETMDQVLERTGDTLPSEFHVARRAVFENCVVVETDPTQLVSTVMFDTMGGVSSINTPSDVTDVCSPALLMATSVTYTVRLVGRGEGRGWRREDEEGGRGDGERRESSPGEVPTHTR